MPHATEDNISRLVEAIIRHRENEIPCDIWPHKEQLEDLDIRTGRLGPSSRRSPLDQRGGIEPEPTDYTKDGDAKKETDLHKKKQKKQNVDIASYENEHVNSAIYLGARILEGNPREVKRFINLFRLQLYIANERGLFEEKIIGDKVTGITVDRLAIWVAWSIRWPEISRQLFEEAQFWELREFLKCISKSIDDKNYKLPHDKYMELVTYVRGDDRLTDQVLSKTYPLHWRNLPWYLWLHKSYFLKSIKQMECFWEQPYNGQSDWLQALLKMTRVTFRDQPIKVD